MKRIVCDICGAYLDNKRRYHFRQITFRGIYDLHACEKCFDEFKQLAKTRNLAEKIEKGIDYE